MASPVYIAVNQTSSDIDLIELRITIPASDQITISDFNPIWKIQGDPELISAISNNQVLINDGTDTLNKSTSLQYVSPVAAKQILLNVEEGADVSNWTNVSPALGSRAGAVANLVFKSNGLGSGEMVKNTQVIAQRLTVGMSGDVNYNTIHEAVTAAISGGASATYVYDITVYPGTYTEPPMSVPEGVSIQSPVVNSDSVFIIASNPNADLFTMSGGAITNISASGVTDPNKCLFRCATPYTVNLLSQLSFDNCSNGIIVSGGANCICTSSGIIITNPSRPIGTAVKVSGVGSSFTTLGVLFLVPQGLIPYVTSNPIQTVIRVSDGAFIQASSTTFEVAYYDNTADVILCDGGSSINVSSSIFNGCGNAIHIGSSGSNTTVTTNGITMVGNYMNCVIDSSTGLFFANASVDESKKQITTGAVLAGMVQYQLNRSLNIIGPTNYQYDSSKIVPLDVYFSDFASTGVSTGGIVTSGTGLHVDIESGGGWIHRGDPYFDTNYVSWDAVEDLDIQASNTNYIIFNSTTSDIEAITSPPSDLHVLLATVITDGSGIRYVHNTRTVLDGFPHRFDQYLTDTRKRALKSGIATIQGTTNRKIDVGSGSYYLALNLISFPGSSGDATFSYFYGTNGATEVASQTQLDITYYDNAGTLTAMTSGYYRSDTVIVTSDGRINVIYGTSEYSTQPLAEAANLGNTPTFIEPSAFPSSKIIVHQGVGIVSIIDARPQPGQNSSTGSSGVSVHSALSGLSADDHTQYLLVNGTRSMSGDLNLGGNDIINVTTVDGIDVSTHASRHNPGGSDSLSVGTPVAVSVGSSPSTGTGSSYALNDHQHGISAGTPSSIGTSNSAGTASSVARSDHIHSHGAQTDGTLHSAVVAAGASGFMTGSDKTKLDGIASGATNTPITSSLPENVTKSTAAVGVSSSVARSDHKHDINTGTASSLTVGGSNAEGTATSLARSDHTHAIPDFGSTSNTFCEGNDSRLSDDRTASGIRTASTIVGVSSATAPSSGQVLTATSTTAATWQNPLVLTSSAPANVTKSAADAGVDTSAARSDHKHDISTATASSVGTSNSEGTATSLSRSDHVHSGLTRGSSDFSSFTQKSSLVSADVFLIEDSAASNAKKYVTYSSITSGIHGDFANGGDTAGANRTLGNNDSYSISLSTNGTPRLVISSVGNVSITNKLTSGTYILSSTSDLSLIPVSSGQSVVSSYYGLQLVGNKQSTVDYSPSNVGNAGDFGVIIPSQQTGSIALAVRGASGQTGALTQWQDSTGAPLASIDASGNITAGTYNSVSVTAHASRHQPGGSDAISTGTPSTIGTSNSAGTATSLVRSDHVHAHGAQTDGTLHAAAIASSTSGFMTGTDKAKLDGIASGATNTPLTSSAPANVTKSSAAVGVSTNAAREDHKHDITTAAASSLVMGGANAEGTATSLARSDHNHAIAAFGSTIGTFCQGNDSRLSDDRVASGIRTATTVVGVSSSTAPSSGQVLVASSSTAAAWTTILTSNPPSNVTKSTASAGTATDVSRSDHKHDITTAAAVSVGTANAEGTATSLSRSDHIHSGLTRGASDFSSFTQKSSLVSADVFLIEDFAASGAKKYATYSSVISGAHGDFSNGGDTTGANRTLGNNDAYSLSFLTSGSTRFNIASNGDCDIIGSLNTYKYLLSPGPYLSMIIVNPGIPGQSVISSFYGLQLVGNKQSTVNYSPSDIGASGDYGVIIPNQQPTSVGLMIRAASGQSAHLQEWRDSTTTVISYVDYDGKIYAPMVNVADRTTDPSAPITGCYIYSKHRGGRRMMTQFSTVGSDYSFQPSLFGPKTSLWTAQGNGTTVSNIGFGTNNTGTATTRNVATTNFFTSIRRLGLVSSGTAGSSAGIRHGLNQFFSGNGTAGVGGYFFVARFGISQTQNNYRWFVGMCNTTAVITNVNPSTLLNVVGVGMDTGDTNIQFMYNDGSGSCTKVDLGASWPKPTANTEFFEFRVFVAPNGSTIYLSLENLDPTSGLVAEANTSTNIPTNTTLLNPQVWINNSSTNGAVGIDVSTLYIETDN